MKTHRFSRSLRFGLRTLFIVVSLACCWLSWQVKIVHDRRVLRKWIDQNEVIWTGTIQLTVPTPSLSWIRTFLGDELESWPLRFRSDVDREKLQEVKRVFPEATFWIED